MCGGTSSSTREQECLSAPWQLTKAGIRKETEDRVGSVFRGPGK